MLAFVRSDGKSRLLCAFNLSAMPVTLPLAGERVASVLSESGASGATAQAATLSFEPWGVLFARLA